MTAAARKASALYYAELWTDGVYQSVTVTPEYSVIVSGPSVMSPRVAAALRTLLDEALASVAEREGGGPRPDLTSPQQRFVGGV